MTVLTPEQMGKIDRSLPKDWGLDSLLLMENAASAASEAIRKHFPRGSKALIFCGPGNNGGDGLALARILHSYHFSISLCILADAGKYKNDSLKQFQLCERSGIPFLDPENLPEETHWDFVVDALLGTGMNRPPEGLILQAIEWINRCSCYCFSLDIPSGVDGKTGRVPGAAVEAHETISFGRPKPGNLLYPGYRNQGKLCTSPISIPPQIIQQSESRISCLDHPVLPLLQRDIHKGSKGYGLVIGGSVNYRGAPRFCAEAFLRSGGGYVHLAAPREVIESTAPPFPECILHPMGDSSNSWAPDCITELSALLKQKNWVVIGPGMGLSPGAENMLLRLLPEVKVPLILDGDGLTLMRNHLQKLRDHSAPLILTPHPGEAAGLLNGSVQDILTDPIKASREIAEKTQAWVILKQPHSLLTDPGGSVSINLSGSPALATAGSGDVLTGIIPAMLGLGLQPAEACRAAMRIHGLAGEILESEQGAEGAIAGDIIKCLPKALNLYRKGRPERIQIV